MAPLTSRGKRGLLLAGPVSEQIREVPWTGGAEGIRTPDPHNAIVVLYQLSYDPSQDAGNSNETG